MSPQLPLAPLYALLAQVRVQLLPIGRARHRGILDAQAFGVSGDNFSAGFSHRGVISAFACRRGTTCDYSIFSQLGGFGRGGDEFLQGQSGERMIGGVTVTGPLLLIGGVWPFLIVHGRFRLIGSRRSSRVGPGNAG
jgi:hypothetical protein